MEDGYILGMLDPNYMYKVARIKILDPRDVVDIHPALTYHPEQTLVHELIHLYFDAARMADKDVKDLYPVVELGVENIAVALFELGGEKELP